MPIYEYQCVECDHIEEVIQKVSDDPLVDCPACSKPSLKKKVTAAAFRLSGGGWYETDFKEKPKTKDKQKEAKTPAKNKEHSTTKPESSSTATKAEPQQATQATTK